MPWCSPLNGMSSAIWIWRLAHRMAQAVLIDGRNLFDDAKARSSGFDYAGIGHGVKTQTRTPARKAMSAVASYDTRVRALQTVR